MTTATQTQIRRDTATNLTAATPVAGELGYDTTNKRLVVGDGSTAGGIKHASAKDVQNQTFIYPTVGGTGDVITLTNTPVKSSLVAGTGGWFKAGATNTTNVTVQEDSNAAKALKKMLNGALASLAAGDLVSGGIYEYVYDGTQYQVFGLGTSSASTGLPTAVTGSVTGASTAFTVDFTTYSAYDIMLDGAGVSSGSDVAIDVSSNGGVGYASETWLGNDINGTTVTNDTSGNVIDNGTWSLCGKIYQCSTSGRTMLHYLAWNGNTKNRYGMTAYATSAAVNKVKVTIPGGSASIILQPCSKR